MGRLAGIWLYGTHWRNRTHFGNCRAFCPWSGRKDACIRAAEKGIGESYNTLIANSAGLIKEFDDINIENGKDVTYSACTATYEWMSTPDIIRNYKKKYYLSGGMAMHLKLKKGRYKISLYTPADQQNNFTYAEIEAKPFQWESNVFEYNTENPAKVIFVTPTRNDNGFYNVGWIIDYRDGRKP